MSICGPKMKSHRSTSLGKQVFDEYRHFLHRNHKYQTTKKHLFNGKEETVHQNHEECHLVYGSWNIIELIVKVIHRIKLFIYHI